MKFSPVWYVVFGLTAIVIYLILTKPKPTLETEREAAYKYEIAILKCSLDSTRKAGTTIVEKFNTRVVKDSVSLKAKDREIRVLEVKLSKQRTPRVDTLILENPDLASFVETQGEIIGELKEQVDTLKASNDFYIQTNKDLIQNHKAEANISNRIDQEKDARITRLEKDVRNVRRKFTVAKILIPAVGVAMFLLGSQ